MIEKKMHSPIAFLLSVILISTTIAYSQTSTWFQQSNGPFGGIISSLAINSQGHLFAGTRGGGVFSSVDNGENWTQIGLTSDAEFIDIRSFDVTSKGDIYAVTNVGLFRYAGTANNWIKLNTDFMAVNAIVINSNDLIFAAGGGGVYRSIDQGVSWNQVNLGLNSTNVSFITIDSNDVLLAATFRGIYRSTNNGDSWTDISNGLTDLNITRVFVDSTGDIYITSGGNIFVSSDDGQSWTDISLDSPVSIFSIAASPSEAIFVVGDGIYRSTDKGDNWTQLNVGLPIRFYRSILVKPDGHIFLGSEGGGVFRSADNGDTWIQITEGIANTTVEAIATSTNGDIFAGTNGSGLFRTSNDGQSWNQVNSDLMNTSVQSLALLANGHIFAGAGTGMLRSTDNGESWSEVSNALTNISIRSIAIDGNQFIYAGTNVGIFRSVDSGATWTQVNNGLGFLHVKSVSASPDADIFAIAAGLYRSTDKGENWTLVRPNITGVLAINSNSFLYLANGDGVFRSTDKGKTLSQILTFPSVRCIGVYSDRFIVAGTAVGGVFLSRDFGDSWNEINEGLTNLNIQSIAIDDNQLIIAGSEGGGVFKSIQTVTSVNISSIKTPRFFVLEQNFPNPFNPTTEIRYELAKYSEVNLTIYNQLGQEVRALVVGKKHAGVYQIQWDGRDNNGNPVASGIYVYRITASGFAETRKMMLIR